MIDPRVAPATTGIATPTRHPHRINMTATTVDPTTPRGAATTRTTFCCHSLSPFPSGIQRPQFNQERTISFSFPIPCDFPGPFHRHPSNHPSAPLRVHRPRPSPNHSLTPIHPHPPRSSSDRAFPLGPHLHEPAQAISPRPCIACACTAAFSRWVRYSYPVNPYRHSALLSLKPSNSQNPSLLLHPLYLHSIINTGYKPAASQPR